MSERGNPCQLEVEGGLSVCEALRGVRMPRLICHHYCVAHGILKKSSSPIHSFFFSFSQDHYYSDSHVEWCIRRGTIVSIAEPKYKQSDYPRSILEDYPEGT